MKYKDVKELVDCDYLVKYLTLPAIVYIDGQPQPTEMCMTQEFAVAWFDELVNQYGALGVDLDSLEFQVAVSGHDVLFLADPMARLH